MNWFQRTLIPCTTSPALSPAGWRAERYRTDPMVESVTTLSPAGVAGEPGQRPLRVAHIITGLELGGGGAVTATIANAIDRARFELDVFCIIEGGPMEAAVRGTGCTVEVLEGTYDYHRRFFTYSPRR